MSLADLLVIRPEFRRRPLDMALLEIAILRMEQAFQGFGAKSPEEVAALVQRVARAVELESWEGVSTGDIARSLQALLNGEQPLPEILRVFLTEEMSATTSPRLLDVLARAYLETWEAGATKTRNLRALILAKSEDLPLRWRTLFQACPEFLDIASGPLGLAKRMVETSTPYDWLRGHGLAAPHDQGFMRLAHSEFVRESRAPEDAAALDKLMSWIAPPNAPALEDDRAAEVVDRILSPWMTRPCPSDYREQCAARLFDRFGDPRRDKPAFWALVGGEGKRVLYKWLARKSMEAMFEVVTKAATDADNARLWTNRKRFWLGLYEAGHIDEAWVVLGQEAVPFARALHQQTGDKSFLNFGRQSGRSDTSLLLMKIGNKTVVEGSHNFRVHVFPTPSRQTPQLYSETYDLDKIMLPDHHHDARRHNGGWMEWVRDRIHS
jgi:hypothetical protein